MGDYFLLRYSHNCCQEDKNNSAANKTFEYLLKKTKQNEMKKKKNSKSFYIKIKSRCSSQCVCICVCVCAANVKRNKRKNCMNIKRS